ncbi:hypothetical protein [Granulicatella adiacens]
MTNLETLKQQTADLEAKLKEMKAEIDRLENGWELKCPYKKGHEYWLLDSHGEPVLFNWNDCNFEKCYLKQGNTFKTKEAALLEAKRRNLLTRFRAFRDECNGDWKVDWSGDDRKWSISKNEEGLFDAWAKGMDTFSIFGYFKNQEDCKKAINLFGKEIKELFVDGE